jgi:hypothetical protein
MKTYTKIIKYSEIILVVFVWMVLIITPVLFRDDYNNPVWRSIHNQLEIMVPLSIIFLINRFILVPKLLFRGRWILFISSVFGAILILTVGSYLYDTNIKKTPPPGSVISEADVRRNPPPELIPGSDDQIRNNQPPQPGQKIQPRQPRQPRPMPPFANFLILSVLIVGFDTGVRSGLRLIESENEKVSLEKENVANQLVMLRNQVSPHFFMNTLNNIHSLIDINTEEAKEAIIKLSKMMRYLLYETEAETTTLRKEVEFLESYINLMKLRFNEKVKITLNLPALIPDKPLPPLIFTSLIENAFKHGVSYKDESYISIDLVFGEERLLLVVKNSKQGTDHIEEFSGIGIENTRKRLTLLYGTDYHLDIIDGPDQFTVNLSIPL